MQTWLRLEHVYYDQIDCDTGQRQSEQFATDAERIDYYIDHKHGDAFGGIYIYTHTSILTSYSYTYTGACNRLCRDGTTRDI